MRIPVTSFIKHLGCQGAVCQRDRQAHRVALSLAELTQAAETPLWGQESCLVPGRGSSEEMILSSPHSILPFE